MMGSMETALLNHQKLMIQKVASDLSTGIADFRLDPNVKIQITHKDTGFFIDPITSLFVQPEAAALFYDLSVLMYRDIHKMSFSSAIGEKALPHDRALKLLYKRVETWVLKNPEAKRCSRASNTL